MLLTEPGWNRGRHRRPRTPGVRPRVADLLRALTSKLVEHDAPLVLAVSLVALGFVFMGIGGIFWFAAQNQLVAFLTTSTGIACWVFGCIVFVLFPPSSSPRHSKDS